MKKAIAYTRVSTAGQLESGSGLDFQMTAIRAFAKAAGYEIVEAFSDAHTGVGEDSITDRPGVQAALEKARRTGWPVLVDGLDRLSRHSKTLEDLIADNGARVLSVRDGEAPTRAVLIARAARAQEEAERISVTTREGLARARQNGVVLGNQTNLREAQRLGAERNRTRAGQRAGELAPIISEVLASGKSTHGEIADELNRRGILTPRGKAWTAASIRRPLARIKDIQSSAESNSSSSDSDNPLWGIF